MLHPGSTAWDPLAPVSNIWGGPIRNIDVQVIKLSVIWAIKLEYYTGPMFLPS